MSALKKQFTGYVTALAVTAATALTPLTANAGSSGASSGSASNQNGVSTTSSSAAADAAAAAAAGNGYGGAGGAGGTATGGQGGTGGQGVGSVEGDNVSSRALGLSTSFSYGDLPGLSATQNAIIATCAEETNVDKSTSLLGGYLFSTRDAEASRTAGSSAFAVPVARQDENGNWSVETALDAREYLEMDPKHFTQAFNLLDEDQQMKAEFAICVEDAKQTAKTGLESKVADRANQRQHEVDLATMQAETQKDLAKVDAFSTGFGAVVNGYYNQQINKDTQDAATQRTAIIAGVDLATSGPTDHVSATDEGVVLREKAIYGEDCNAFGLACDTVVIGHEQVPVSTSVANMKVGSAGGEDDIEHRRAWSIATTAEQLVQQGLTDADKAAEARKLRQQGDLQVADYFINQLPSLD